MSRIPVSFGKKPAFPESAELRAEKPLDSLREAVHSQEFKVWSIAEGHEGDHVNNDVTEDVIRTSSGESRLMTSSGEKIARLSRADDDLEDTHWSESLETINSSTCALKQRLRNQDEYVAALAAELGRARAELRKKDKQIKKLNFLLKAEREMFEKYKKDTCSEIKNKKSEENNAKKSSGTKISRVEIEMMKSELAHYKQMNSEMKRTVQRLEKEVNQLKIDRQHLRGLFCEEDAKSRKLLLETSNRFEICRREFQLAVSKSLENEKCSSMRSAICKIVDRNAKLAYDNSMLKWDLEKVKNELNACLKGNPRLTKTQSMTETLNPLHEIEEENYSKLEVKAVNRNSDQSDIAQHSDLSLYINHSKTNRILTDKTSPHFTEPEPERRVINKRKNIHRVAADDDNTLIRSESEPNLNTKSGKGEDR